MLIQTAQKMILSHVYTLTRVEENTIQFQDFVSILRGTTGMDVVVKELEEKEEKFYKSLSMNVSMYLH